MSLALLLLLALGYLNGTVGEYVCYPDDSCSTEEPRPVFSLADTLDECCILPNIASGRLHDSTNCSYCGQPFARAVGPVNITLSPPSTLVLEVAVRGFSVITWLVNGSAMHSFPRLSLEQYSQRLILVNTTEEDAGLYEADIYLIGGGGPLVVQFNVLPPITPIVTAWPSVKELNIHQTVTTAVFMCEGTESLTWTTELIPGPLRDYCDSDVDYGEAPLDTDPTSQPTDMLGEASLETDFTPQLTHCRVLSSEALRNTDTVLSILTIEGGMLRQSLNFTCTGNESSSTDTVQLVVTDEPYFTRHPRPTVNIVITQELELVCEATADITPTLTWLRKTVNETTVVSSASPRFNITNSVTVSAVSALSVLRVESVETADAGEYVCRASGNNDSVAETSTLVHVRVPANISEGPVDSEFMVGTVAQLFCHSSGIPLPMITWSRVFVNGSRQMLDDLSITEPEEYIITTYSQSEDVSSNLTFPLFQVSQAGQYACTAVNGVSLPEGYSQDQEASLAVECSETEFRCTDAVQCVPSILTCDLVADCEDGSDENCAQFPATILTVPENGTVRAYNSTFFLCEAFSENVVVTWLFQGEPLISIEEVETSYNPESRVTTSTLTLSSPSLEDSGLYTCSVSNGVPAISPRTRQTANASLLVLSIIPTIEIRPEVKGPLIRAERDTLHLECHAQASPPPLINWLRNSRPLTLGTVLPEENKLRTFYTELGSGRAVNVLDVRRLLPGNDDGEYTCRLENTLDPTTNVSIKANVFVIIEPLDNCANAVCLNNGTCQDLVEGFVCVCTPLFEGPACSRPVKAVVPPEIVQSPRDVEVEILQVVEFFCDAMASPQPTYSWFKDGVFLVNTGPVGVLRVTQAQPEDRGLYTCLAENVHGSSGESNAGLLTLSGVYQYLVNFTDCTIEGLLPTISIMTTSLVSVLLPPPLINSTLYSFTARPLLIGPPPSNQVIVTVITGKEYQPTGPTTEELKTAVLSRLQSLTLSHSCRFPVITRYDGCPKDTYSFSTTGVLWAESPIHPTPIVQMCPCGSLNASLEESQRLSRMCGGTFRLGGEWESVDNQCGFSLITHGLCDITNFRVEEQYRRLENATQDSPQFDAFDLNIVSLIVRLLSEDPQVVTDTVHQKNFAKTYSNLLLANKVEVTKSQQQFQASSSLLESLGVFVLGINVDEEGTDLITELLQISVMDVNELSGYTYVPQLPNTSGLLMGVNITLPSELLLSGRRVANTVLLRDTLFVFNLSGPNEQMLGNLFISASLRQSVKNLSEPVIIEFYLSDMPDNNTENATCVFWDLSAKDGAGDWSQEGCQVAGLEEGKVTCKCDHLTHFGVLLSIGPVEPSLPLEIITYIGTGLSLVCIVVILLTYLCSRKLRQNVPGKLLVNMCIPLGLFYCWFLVAIHGRYYGSIEWFCFLSSSLVQYFLLVYLCWTAAESLHIYLKLVRVFESNVQYYVFKAALWAWGVPALLTALCTGLGVHYRLWAIYDDQDTIFICYPNGWPRYFGVIAPFALIFLFNVIIFIAVMVSLTKHFYRNSKRNPSKQSHVQELRKLIFIATSLSVLFGLGWIAGIVAGVPQKTVSHVAQYVFSVLVGLQGFLIFLLHGVRSSDVRGVWKRWCYRVFCCRTLLPSKFLSTTTGSPLPSPTSKTAPPVFSKLASPPVSPVDSNRHSENPLYQSTDALSTSYSPTHDTAALITQEDEEDEMEWQSLEVNFEANGPSDSDSEPDLTDMGLVPFSKGQLGTAMGYQDHTVIDETTQLSKGQLGTAMRYQDHTVIDETTQL